MGKSLFLEINNEQIEIALYKITDIFPLPTKYIEVDIGDEHNWYIPLNYINSEFDSGLRYTIGDVTYQVCSRCPLNAIAQFLNGYNYIIECNNLLYEQMAYVFEGRVYKEDDTIKLIGPSRVSGITKLFLCGTDISISYDNVEISTRNNAFGTSERNKDDTSHAILVKLEQGKLYTIKFKNNNNISKNFIFLGNDIESLPEKAGKYNKVYDFYYRFYKNNGLINYNEDEEFINKLEYIKNNILADKESKNIYNYYDLC